MRDISQWFFEKERELAENERVNELSFSCWLVSDFFGYTRFLWSRKVQRNLFAVSKFNQKIIIIIIIK